VNLDRTNEKDPWVAIQEGDEELYDKYILCTRLRTKHVGMLRSFVWVCRDFESQHVSIFDYIGNFSRFAKIELQQDYFNKRQVGIFILCDTTS
jgi:hypothetical protein